MKQNFKLKKPVWNANLTMRKLMVIIWSKRVIPTEVKSHSRTIKIWRAFYAILISSVCLVSAFSLISAPEAIRPTWNKILAVMQIMTFFVFVADYCLHLITFRYRDTAVKRKSFWYNLMFIISLKGIIILLSILSSISVVGLLSNNQGIIEVSRYFKSLNIFRFFRLFFILTLFSPFAIIIDVFQKQRKILFMVFLMIALMIVLFAILILNNERTYLAEIQSEWIKNNPTIIDYLNNADYKALSNNYVMTFADSLYFTTITLTTIGYGDFSPHAPTTRAIVTVIALLGIAVIAIPSGIVASAFLADIQKHLQKGKNA
ncbi:potassium channel family protein [Mycoplasma phocoenae]|uniref:Potassium channel family protein n=1 Tax=Mycoplasma phocoenae TaxID=754517 RepID=A0A858U8N9_9MOLU|nr:potassium channel family protein [Mycoplasma phocoenae]QJG67076.1 potassium channel family protein [Mycoplasma phocoenae]